MSQDPHSYDRASQAALIGLMVQAVLTLVMAVLCFYTASPAVYAALWYVLGGLPIWAVLLMVYHQHQLERAEALETDQLAGANPSRVAGAKLFDEQGDDLLLARRRLGHLYKWVLNAVSLCVGVYLLAMGLWLVSDQYDAHRAGRLIGDAIGLGVNTAVVMGVLAGSAFVAFVVARYESGMTEISAWRLLRGGAGYLIGTSVAATLLLIGVLFAHYGNPAVLGVMGVIVPSLMVLAGSEMLLALLLSTYRPRRAGEVPRPAFDSRLMGWMTNPGSIAKALGDAINYQLGFEVSRSWFFQLLGRAVTPLTGFSLAVLVGISCVVIVSPHERAIVTSLGRVHGQPLGPGLHVKFPWPVQKAEKYGVGRVHQVLVGSTQAVPHADDAILWDKPHTHDEQYLITAPTPLTGGGSTRDDEAQGASGISLVGAEVAVQYRIADLERYVSAARNGRAMITAIAERRVNAYFLMNDIDTLLGKGRMVAGRDLLGLIQDDVDGVGLGIDIVFVGLISIHPPADQGVAGAFLTQIGAMQERGSMIEQARQEAVELLASVAGSHDKALAINGAIEAQQEVPSANHQAEIEKLLTTAGGEAAQIIYEARADRWERVTTERAAAERFDAEVLAYRSAPGYYRAKRYLDTLAKSLAGARKYIVTTGRDVPPIYRIDLKDTGSAIESIFQQGQ